MASVLVALMVLLILVFALGTVLLFAKLVRSQAGKAR
jgi:hypothetical protein